MGRCISLLCPNVKKKTFFNPWRLKAGKVKSREQKTGEGRSVVSFYCGKRKLTAVKVSRQCPLVLLVKVGR
jgi:hypothetical protein